MNYWIHNPAIGLTPNRDVTSIEDFPAGCIGFTYSIICDNRIYIGKKDLYSTTKKKFGKKKLATVTDARKKTYEMVKKESNWKTYTGSNKDLNELIKSGSHYVKVITGFAFSKKHLTYLELEKLFEAKVLEKDNYFNDNILGKFFRRDFQFDDDKGI